ncbi:MAG: ATP-dependent DNA helicase [Proteobacteria bacterium]|nr:ATP-dependent DNA helicase [Pseudomonadota bacterium]
MHFPARIFGPDGPLARGIEGFAARTAQQEMAEAVAEALANQDILITEAGTGTGKTFAYLVPALLSGKKIIVSTATKTLQDQLYQRDFPAVRAALAAPGRVALLKGRANYLCLHRLELTEQQQRYHAPAQAAELARIRAWAGQTQSGDIAELSDIREDSALWPQVTSTADNCLGQQCPSFKDCHVLRARSEAQAADVLVINHHLFFADMALRAEGFGDLLPGVQGVIFDEAHQLAEIAAGFFGVALGSRQLIDLAQDTVAEYLKEAGDMRELATVAEHLEKATRDLRLAFGVDERRGAWREVKEQSTFTSALGTLQQALNGLHNLLEVAAVRGKGLENCWRRCITLQERLELFTTAAPENHVAWFETYTRAFTLNLTPVDIAQQFHERIQAQKCAWIFTSATLAVGDSFAHFTARLGLEDATTRRWDSPFDFARLALLYVPRNLPDPAEASYTAGVIEAALPVLNASGGRAFLLFTSHRALREAAELLKDRLGFPLLVQGSAPRAELLDRFRALGNAVLLGSASFWEGVDVRGPALSCVIIDKLPFASPGDPLMQARLEALRAADGNPFKDYQLPQAVLALKQGVGRLIRDTHDRGVLMLCDPRLFSKSYGKIFLNSLPPVPLTRSVTDVEEFFAAEEVT